MFEIGGNQQNLPSAELPVARQTRLFQMGRRNTKLEAHAPALRTVVSRRAPNPFEIVVSAWRQGVPLSEGLRHQESPMIRSQSRKMASPNYKHDKRKNLASATDVNVPCTLLVIFFQIATQAFSQRGLRLSKCVRMCPRALDLVPLTGIKLVFRRLASNMLSGYVAGYLVRRFNPFRP